MLTTLSTIKSRLSILDSDTIYDSLLTTAIKAISARFDKECRRTLARTIGATFEFSADETELCVPCYPIETVTAFHLKSTEPEGWHEEPACEYLVLRSTIISLRRPLGPSNNLARISYTGGYLLPGSPPPDPPVAQCQNLPDDLEQAAVEQVAYWFQKRDNLGLRIYWPSGLAYQQFASQDLLETVTSTLTSYARYCL